MINSMRCEVIIDTGEDLSLISFLSCEHHAPTVHGRSMTAASLPWPTQLSPSGAGLRGCVGGTFGPPQSYGPICRCGKRQLRSSTGRGFPPCPRHFYQPSAARRASKGLSIESVHLWALTHTSFIRAKPIETCIFPRASARGCAHPSAYSGNPEPRSRQLGGVHQLTEVDGDSLQTLPSPDSCVTDEELAQLRTLLHEFTNRFNDSSDPLAAISLLQARLETKDTPPIFGPPRHLSPAMRNVVRQAVADMDA
ncbi:hypothetical protein Esti_001321 [Eimeria stiedai]